MRWRRMAHGLRPGISMRTDLFDFELPQNRIALHPVSPRDAARLLLVWQEPRFEDRIVSELPELLGSLLTSAAPTRCRS